MAQVKSAPQLEIAIMIVNDASGYRTLRTVAMAMPAQEWSSAATGMPRALSSPRRDDL